MRVGTIPASTSQVWLAQERVATISYATVEEGLESLIEGGIDAFVYDAPTLKYLILKDFADRAIVLPGTFSPQDYAIALPPGSAMRETINRELLKIKVSDVWAQRVFQYLGDR
jgi:ABC-type amino acid transport substrate-binding protein